MKIKRIRLKNGYKRFHDLTIDLGDNPKRIVALVGPNGCGKSSVFDGMLYIQNSHHQIGNKGSKDYRFHSQKALPGYNWQNIEIILDSGSFNEVYQQKQSDGKAATLFSFRSPYRYNFNLNVTQSQAIPEIWHNNYGASTSTDLDDKMEQNYRRLNIKYNNYLNDQDCKPSEAKKKIIGDLNASIGNCLNLLITSLGDIEASKGTLFFKKPDYDAEFDFNVLSSGEKEVVDLLLDLYLRQDEYSETIFVIDEPELHISTAIQRKLLLEIDRLVGEKCQIWISTHSIGFLRALQDEMKDKCQVIKFSSDDDYGSKAYTLKPVEVSQLQWRDIFSIAIDDLAYLVSPKRIIYCEGRDTPNKKGEERGFDAKGYNQVFGQEFPDTLFISSGGNTELDQRSGIAMTIIGKALPDVEIWVLKDRDIASGKPVDEVGRKLYLNTNSKSHRVLKRWEIENYLFDKEVLKKYCADNDLDFDEKSYDMFVTNIIDQNIKDETGRIKNFCGIKTSINVEIFKMELAKYISTSMAVYDELKECVFNRN